MNNVTSKNSFKDNPIRLDYYNLINKEFFSNPISGQSSAKIFSKGFKNTNNNKFPQKNKFTKNNSNSNLNPFDSFSSQEAYKKNNNNQSNNGKIIDLQLITNKNKNKIKSLSFSRSSDEIDTQMSNERRVDSKKIQNKKFGYSLNFSNKNIFSSNNNSKYNSNYNSNNNNNSLISNMTGPRYAFSNNNRSKSNSNLLNSGGVSCFLPSGNCSTIQQTSSPLYLAEISNNKNFQNSMINFLLNQKMTVTNRKMKTLKPFDNFNINKENNNNNGSNENNKNNNCSGNNTNNNKIDEKKYKYQRKFLLNAKPIQQFFFFNKTKNINDKNKNKDKKNKLQPLSLSNNTYIDSTNVNNNNTNIKLKDEEENKNQKQKEKKKPNLEIEKNENEKNLQIFDDKCIYEVIGLGGEKSLVVTKLICKEEDPNNSGYSCEDFHSVMKPPVLKGGEQLSLEDASRYFRGYSSYKKKRKKKIFRNKSDNISFKEIKSLSEKGFEQLQHKRACYYSRKIERTLDNVQDNRKRLKKLIERNIKMFDKNQEEVLNDDL